MCSLEQLRDDVPKCSVRVHDCFRSLLHRRAVPYVHSRDDLTDLVGPCPGRRCARSRVLRFEDDKLECHVSLPDR